MKNSLFRLSAILTIFTVLSFSVKQDDAALQAKADRIHKSVISMDTHTDTAMRMYRGTDPANLQVNLEKMRIYFSTKADISERTNMRTEILGYEQEFYQLESDIHQLEKAIRYAELQVLQ